MKKQLYIFNPWHDMALANFTPYYKVSAEILRMSHDLSFLPAWYAPDDALIHVADCSTVETFRSLVASFKVFSSERFVSDTVSCEIRPWGWSPALVHMLSAGGADIFFLPDSASLDKIRYLSGRQRCVEVLSQLSSVDGVCGETFCCSKLEEVRMHLEANGSLILKAPWSGSGRGLYRVCRQSWNANVEGWISRILRTQGCVMAEPIYNKVCDFAMEFYSSPEGTVSFAGYSLFETDDFGNYKQNILMCDSGIEEHLLSFGIQTATLHDVRERLLEIFSGMVSGYYTGYFGVDMMICNQNGDILVHPCVEINMRMNMGVVSRIIFDRYLCPSSRGKFVVEHYNSDGEAVLSHQKMSSSMPLVVDTSGRIKSGYLTLTPLQSVTRYHAYVIVKG